MTVVKSWIRESSMFGLFALSIRSFCGLSSFEQGEVDTAVIAVLNESGMSCEVVVLAVLKAENAVLSKDAFRQNKVGQVGQCLQLIGWVGKDELELLVAAFYESEYIALDECMVVCPYFGDALTDKTCVVAVGFHTDHLLAAPRKQFERYAARAREQVESGDAFKVEITAENIENVFLCKICRRPGLERAWDFKMAAFVDTCDYSHFFKKCVIMSSCIPLIRVMGARLKAAVTLCTYTF